MRQRKVFGKYIVSDPKICHGNLTFIGTRILVETVLELVALGMDWDRIIRECHGSITHEGIEEAINLARRALLGHVDADAQDAISA